MAREIPVVDGVEHRYVEANGIRIHVAEAGSAAAPAIVCLHGWPQHWYLWREVIGPLAETHRVICPDLRGLGWTDAPPGGYDKESLATDLLALLDTLELDRVSLIGHDWGGYACFLACLRQPERFERYLGLNIAPPFARRSPETFAATWRFGYQVLLASPLGAGAAARLGSPQGKERFRRRGSSPFGDAELETFFGQFREPERARATVQYYRSFLLRDLPAVAAGRYARARLEVPTRILFGTDDPVVTPSMLTVDGRQVADYAVELVPGVGHFIADERPDLVVARAQAWLGK